MKCVCGCDYERHFESLSAGAGCSACPHCQAFDLAPIEAPDVVGEVEAWRAWRVHGPNHKPRLFSVTWGGNGWPTDEWYTADCGGSPTCRHDGGRIPGEVCTCGLYAARDREHLRSLGYNRYTPGMIQNRVIIGKVGFAGKVIPGAQGWRAEKGRIIALHVPYELHKIAKALGRDYGADVVLDETMEAASVVYARKAASLRKLAEREQSRGRTAKAEKALRLAEDYELKSQREA